MMLMSRLPRPEPAAGIRAYADEVLARRALDARCDENYGRYLAAGHLSAELDYIPVKLDVENVSRCNFACTMCAVSKWPKRRRARDMTLDAFKALIDEQYGLIEIKLNGLGEAMMQGDDWFAMIRYARERRIWVRVTTNASLLHVNENCFKLVESGVNEIDVSIDGADKETFETIRVGSTFERVVANCVMLNSMLKAHGKPSAKMWTLVQRANWRNLPAHVKLSAACGFRQLVFSLNLHGWGDPVLAEKNKTVCVDSEIGAAQLQQLVMLGQESGVRVSFWDVNEKFSTAPGKRCPWPFSRAVVTSDLRTVPCCMIADPDQYEIGKGHSFMENWRGEEYRAFRQAHLDGAIPAVCKGCYA